MRNQRKSTAALTLSSFLVLSLVLSFSLDAAEGSEHATKVTPGLKAEVQLEKASQALRHHDARLAFKLASEVLNNDPYNGSAYFIRGKARADYDDVKNALVDLTTGMTLAPNAADPSVFLTMAQAYLQLKEPERALYALQLGKLKKPSLEIYEVSSGINDSLGRAEQALLDIDNALKLDPSSRTMFLLRGSIFDKQRDYERAIKDYTRVIEISVKGNLKDSNWLKAIKERAYDYEKTGKIDLAHSDRETLNKEGSAWEKELFDTSK